jgi:hypothetical protein
VALSVIVKEALRAPVLPGVKVTLILQVALAASVLVLAGQVLVWAKSLALVPLSAMLLIVRGDVPELVSVIVWGELVLPVLWLPKFTLVGFKVTAGVPGVVPAPVRVAVCGLPVALSVTVRVAVRAPVLPGVKVTLMVQEAFALREAGQLLVWAKSLALVPLSAMLLILKAVVPLLERVTV